MATARKSRPANEGRPSPLAFCSQLQKGYEAEISIEARKLAGQIFTPPSVARLMAGLLSEIPAEMTLLDPGAGLGILTAAVCERALSYRSPRHIKAHLFEPDPLVRPSLEEVMLYCQTSLGEAGHAFSYHISAKDFILEGPQRSSGQFSLFKTGPSFDAVIMNPPYFKVGVDSPHAKAMAETIKLHTNIYPLFMAQAANALRPDGEMVTITPRSFCNGLYFRDFRRWFFERMSLGHLHLFESRRNTFDDVLQESVITLTRRSKRQSAEIRISSTHGRDIPSDLEHITVAHDRVLRSEPSDTLVYIPTNERDAAILELTESWPERFADLRLKVSTGPVVTFRTEKFLLPSPSKGQPSAPLIAPHNVKPFETVWPLDRRNKPTAFLVSPESVKHLVPTLNYVLIRRFTAKEEKRRLVASCFFGASVESPYLAIENHVNYVYHADRELTEDEVVGLASVFNSALFDSYFRIISGNTQVNATELRTMKFPSLVTMAAVGRRVRALKAFQPDQVEAAVLAELGLTEQFGPQTRESAR